jgi:hypothetical protein
MKTFLKKNFIWVFALALGFTTMSFKAWEQNTLTYFWYPVGTDGYTITSSTPLAGQPNTSHCQASNPATVCAIEVELDPDFPFPANIVEAGANHNVGGNTKRDQ